MRFMWMDTGSVVKIRPSVYSGSGGGLTLNSK